MEKVDTNYELYSRLLEEFNYIKILSVEIEIKVELKLIKSTVNLDGSDRNVLKF